MSPATAPLLQAVALLTYVWHYMLARVLYDELVRPALHGHVGAVALVAAGAVAGVLLLTVRRWRRRA